MATCDTFDGTGAISSDWTNYNGVAARSSGALVYVSGDQAAYYWAIAQPFGADQSSKVTARGAPTSGYGVSVRAAGSDDQTFRGYVVNRTDNSTLTLIRRDPGDNAVALGTPSAAVQDNETIELRITGSHITVLQNDVPVHIISDSEYSDGQPGLQILNPGGTEIEEWCGEDLSAAIMFAADAGALPIAGQPATFSIDRQIAAETGALSIAGPPAMLSLGLQLAADAGVIPIAGQPVTFLTAYSIDAEAGAIPIDGRPAVLFVNDTPTVGGGGSRRKSFGLFF